MSHFTKYSQGPISRLKVIVGLPAAIMFSIAQGQVILPPDLWPTTSSAYNSYSTYWVKKVHTAASGSSSTTTIYSTANKPMSGIARTGRTREVKNGIVSVHRGYFQTTPHNDAATPHFQSPTINGGTRTSHVRFNAEFAADYFVPNGSVASLDLEVYAAIQPVDSKGNGSGNIHDVSRQSNSIMPGEAGRLILSPSMNNRMIYYGRYRTTNPFLAGRSSILGNDRSGLSKRN